MISRYRRHLKSRESRGGRSYRQRSRSGADAPYRPFWFGRNQWGKVSLLVRTKWNQP